jgi:hypothetical protein
MERSLIYEGNTEEENNGYVAFKWKFHGYAGWGTVLEFRNLKNTVCGGEGGGGTPMD